MCSLEPVPECSQNLPDTCPRDASQFSQSTQPVIGPWGYLFPHKPFSKRLCMSEKEYLIGRSNQSHFVLGEEIDHSIWCQLSKKHFRIRRDDLMVVFVDDISSNGTFVNGVKIGNGKSRVLRNNDTIALATSSFKAFTFMDEKPDIEFQNYPPEVLKKYCLSQKLGSGGYGEVRISFNKETGESFAMKIIEKDKFVGRTQVNHPDRVQREINILKRINNTFVVKFHDLIDNPDRVFLVMELMRGGDLFSKVQGRALRESQAKLYFYQLAIAVQYLHSQGIVHRDIKLENILLSSDDQVVKLADFGLSKFVSSESMLKTMCGTPMYIAPEVLKSEGKFGCYDAQADVWSLGIVLYICLSGITPFFMGDNGVLKKQILKGYYSFPRKQWRYISRNAMHLIRRMLNIEPRQRITIDKIFEHPWLQDPEIKSRVRNVIQNNETFFGKENLMTEDEEEEEEIESDSESVRPMKRAKIGIDI